MPAADGARGSTRHTPRLLWLIAAALLAARIATGVAESRRPLEAADLVRWRPIAGAIEEARGSGKPLLYDFTADWCPPCRVMQREVFADRNGARLINTMFVPVRVLDRQREEGRNPPDVAGLQARYRVEAFPTLVVVSAQGEDPTVIRGYRGAPALQRELMEAAMKHRLGKPATAPR
jgi:thiol:disulfide interchange protein